MTHEMAAERQFHFHAGEKKVHKLLKVDGGSEERESWVSGRMAEQDMIFYANLYYFVVGTMDSKGQPWASLITGEPGFMHPLSQTFLAIHTDVSEGDPILENLENGWTIAEGGRVIAGLGIDFANRRRNKVAGRVSNDMFVVHGRKIQMIFAADESLRYCPKYITIHDMKYFKRKGVIKYQVLDMTNGSLPKDALEIIEQCDAVLLAARHFAHDAKEIDDMDVNHRGGKQGFVRVEEDGRTIILPDYSGNLFYSTLGSIESDRLAGLTFPNFTTGDILYITGEAENLYGTEADKIMPSTTLVTRVRITGFIYVEGGLNLVSTKAEPSPYNPPIKYLTTELFKMGKVPRDTRRDIALVDAKLETRDISTFTFEFKDGRPIEIIPGQHAIFDFSAEKTFGYRHMCDDAPQSLNDDFVRSWTISSVPDIDEKGEYILSTKFMCTIKNKYGGAVSPMLHRWAHRRHADLSIKFIGVEGAFTCFDERNRLTYEKLLFIAGGVGITPFMNMLGVFVARKIDADIVLLFSARGDEVNLAKQFKEAGVDTRVFDTGGEDADNEVFKRRVGIEDIEGVPDLKQRGVYICGPDGFMKATKRYLSAGGVDISDIHVESFAF